MLKVEISLIAGLRLAFFGPSHRKPRTHRLVGVPFPSFRWFLLFAVLLNHLVEVANLRKLHQPKLPDLIQKNSCTATRLLIFLRMETMCLLLSFSTRHPNRLVEPLLVVIIDCRWHWLPFVWLGNSLHEVATIVILQKVANLLRVVPIALTIEATALEILDG